MGNEPEEAPDPNMESTSVSTEINDSYENNNMSKQHQVDVTTESIQQILDSESPIPIVVSKPKAPQNGMDQQQAKSPRKPKEKTPASVPRDHTGDSTNDTPLISSPTARKLRVMYENMRERVTELQNLRDSEKAEYERVLLEKNTIIKDLSARLEKHDVIKMNNQDIFVSKLRKGATGPIKCCEISGCSNSDVDLVKCNMCGCLVCEECTGVKITKLRPIMNLCKQLYITCPNCDLLIRDNSDVNAFDVLKGKLDAIDEELGNSEKENENLKHQVSTLTSHQTSLQSLLEERETALQETEARIVSMEQVANASNHPTSGASNLEELFNKRFDKIDKNIDALIEKKLAEARPSIAGEQIGETRKLFSAVVGDTTPGAHIATMKSSRNAELIEKQEQEKRKNNLIIYGISEEVTEETISLQEQDRNFINSVLEQIEVDVTPKQIVRLGNKNADKKRPVKIILNSSEDKEMIVSNLNKLKNANTSLRSISVRDDYTIEERKLIKTMNEEAKKRNQAENVTHWKVRGTPKNGLRVVKITTRK